MGALCTNLNHTHDRLLDYVGLVFVKCWCEQEGYAQKSSRINYDNLGTKREKFKTEYVLVMINRKGDDVKFVVIPSKKLFRT